MRIGVLGVNSKLAGLQLRERLAKTCQKYFSANNALHGEHVTVLLSTCNRTELYFSSSNLPDSHSYILNILRQEIEEEFDQKLYSYFGIDCFLHLCRVTAGLDSAIIGETEIQGQVKNAYEQATEYICLPKELHFLFQKSLMMGKKARALMPKQCDLLGLEHVVFNAGKEYLRDLNDLKVLFIGASEINSKVISFLKSKKIHQITLCNRSHQSAKGILENYHLDWLEWSDLHNWYQYDWIIFGTKANNYLLSCECLPSFDIGKKLIIDLSVPRNVDPNIAKNLNIHLLNIDQLNSSLTERRKQMDLFISGADKLIQQFAHKHTLRFNLKNQECEGYLYSLK